jgi:hypothetical protein
LQAAKAFRFFVASGNTSKSRSTTLFSLVIVIAFIAPSKAGIAADGVGDEIDKETQAPARPRHFRANLKLSPCTAAPTMDIAMKHKRISIFTEAVRENEDIAVEIFGKVLLSSKF